jgi:hypothetical protein
MKTSRLLSRRALATTVSRLAITVLILVGGTMLVAFATPAHATTSSAVTCQTTKLAAAAKRYAGAQKCAIADPRASTQPVPPDGRREVRRGLRQGRHLRHVQRDSKRQSPTGRSAGARCQGVFLMTRGLRSSLAPVAAREACGTCDKPDVKTEGRPGSRP